MGEAHPVKRHHDLQLDLLQQLFLRKFLLVLGLESFTARDPPAIARDNRHELDRATLAGAINCPNKWAHYTDDRLLCEFARQHRTPLRALIARADTARIAPRRCSNRASRASASPVSLTCPPRPPPTVPLAPAQPPLPAPASGQHP